MTNSVLKNNLQFGENGRMLIYCSWNCVEKSKVLTFNFNDPIWLQKEAVKLWRLYKGPVQPSYKKQFSFKAEIFPIKNNDVCSLSTGVAVDTF